MWESFQEMENSNASSKNHHFLGDVTSWMIQNVAGIKPNPCCNDISQFEIAPHYLEALDFAEGYYENEYGKLTAKWVRTENEIELDVEVPAGMKGKLVLTDGHRLVCGCREAELGEGMHVFRIQ